LLEHNASVNRNILIRRIFFQAPNVRIMHLP